MNCTANCQQGRKECPCPEACGLAESMQHYHRTKDLVLSCVLVACCFAVAALTFKVFA